MKKNYQIPETEIVLVGLKKRLLQDDQPDMSGEIDKPMGNENNTFDENDIVKDVTTPTTLWDD